MPLILQWLALMNTAEEAFLFYSLLSAKEKANKKKWDNNSGEKIQENGVYKQ